MPDKIQEGWKHCLPVPAKPCPNSPGGGRRSFCGWSPHTILLSLTAFRATSSDELVLIRSIYEEELH